MVLLAVHYKSMHCNLFWSKQFKKTKSNIPSIGDLFFNINILECLVHVIHTQNNFTSLEHNFCLTSCKTYLQTKEMKKQKGNKRVKHVKYIQ